MRGVAMQEGLVRRELVGLAELQGRQRESPGELVQGRQHEGRIVITFRIERT